MRLDAITLRSVEVAAVRTDLRRGVLGTGGAAHVQRG